MSIVPGPISFPYPEIGTTKRPAGQGCSTCVHSVYCQAFYWLRRDASRPSVTGKGYDPVDAHLGTACKEWTDDINQRITQITTGDIEENYRLSVVEGILVEPFSSGIDDPVTASRNDDK